MEYNFREIEQKWQQRWMEEKTYQVAEDKSKPKFYVLNMFPYPSGAGLHVGHPLGYIASDIYARFKRLQGYNVLNPMGYDAYGLPAEQYAIQTGQHPEKTTFQNIDRYREQLDKIGFCFDWDREVRTCAPGYYKWTQWAFQKMFGSFFSKSPLPTSPKGEESHPAGKARPIEELVAYFEQKGTEGLDEFGVAQTEELHFTAEEWKAMDEKQKSDVLMNYRIAFMGETMVNWCAGLGTVLANDEVVDGVSVRGGFPVEQKKMRQWCLRVSAYAQRLLDGLDTIEWSDSIKETQKNWIGRSEGTEVQFKIASPLPTSPKGEESHAACSSTENLTANNPDGNHSPKGETEGAESVFVGYDFTEHPAHIIKYREVQQKKRTAYEVILDKTPFYGEMGGEVGDSGVLVSENEEIKVLDTKKENGVAIHIVDKLPEQPEAEFMACVDVERRRAIEANHTCTHLLDEALREVLGAHVEQKGSLVTADGLRFDFSHFEKVTPEQIREVEHLVNAKIREDIPLKEYRDYPIEKAKELGAIALFGEKYGDKVRVVQFGTSVEFCGGCHAASTGRLGMVKIIGESSIAAGVRRIEAITGKAVEDKLDKMQDFMTDLRGLLNNAPDLMATIQKAISENKELQSQVDEFKARKAQELKKMLIEKARDVNGVKVIAGVLPLEPQHAKDIAFQLRGQFPEQLLVVIGSESNGKPTLTVSLSDDLVAEGKNAGLYVREAGKLIKGGGGGQPHFATAGGKDPEGLEAAVDKIVEDAVG